MNPNLENIVKWLLWLVASAFVLVAIAVTTLRVTLPNLNHFQPEIHQWINKSAGVEVEFGELGGFWRNTHPSLYLQDVKTKVVDDSSISVGAERVEIEFDLIQSILQRQPVVADLTVHKLALDLSDIDFFATEDTDSSQTISPSNDNQPVIDQINQILLRQLDEFAVLDSQIVYRGIDQEVRRLDVERLRWRNNERFHEAEGVVSVAGTTLNSLLIKSKFVDHGSLRDISGEIFVSAENVEVTHWVKSFLAQDTGIQKGQVSFNGWLTLSRNQPTDAYLELLPSELSWKRSEEHELLLESGILQLNPKKEGWVVSAHSINLRTDDIPWPELDIGFEWLKEGWQLNVSQLDLEAILPLVRLVPDIQSTKSYLIS